MPGLASGLGLHQGISAGVYQVGDLRPVASLDLLENRLTTTVLRCVVVCHHHGLLLVATVLQADAGHGKHVA